MKKYYLICIMMLVLMVSFTACSASSVTMMDSHSLTPPLQAVEDETLVITAVGDIMMHNTQLTAGYRSDTGEYGFSPFFTSVAPLLSSSDLVIGNLETTFSGKEAKYSGYPRFNTPEVLAADLKEAGFDVLTTANNHCLDKGYAGLVDTLNHLDRAGLLHAGTSRSPEEAGAIVMTEKKGVSLALLAYTYGTNGLNVPEHPYAVNYLDLEKIKADIEKARVQNARLVIVSLHFGKEYEPQPGAREKDIVKKVFEAGADLILGHHAHVLQPAELHTFKRTDGKEDKKFVIYSLGNFISDQQGLERRSAIILNLSFGINRETMEPYFKEATAIPIYTRSFRDKGKQYFEVVPVEKALTAIRTGLPHNFTGQDTRNLEKAWKHVTTVFAPAGGSAAALRMEQLD